MQDRRLTNYQKNSLLKPYPSILCHVCIYNTNVAIRQQPHTVHVAAVHAA